MNWRQTHHPARLEERLPNNVVRCHLSPRNCTLKPGQHGFCNVRENRDGRLVTLNYGKGVHPTKEVIETEAIFHYAPGEPILSLGNIGCMLNCDYCHNWKTSQAKLVADHDVVEYSPEQVVQTALDHNIRILSWTYNDPVVWHEFVLETAALARQAGLLNLYKSAFYITPKAVDELLDVIDIFSISIKSIDPNYYRRLTKGRLQPVLDATKQVYRAGKHLEVSTLMVTDLSDREDDAREIAGFVLNELGPDVPLHFVRFHPDYKMRNSVRTPVERLFRAREIALDMGLNHVYLGNVFDAEPCSTTCNKCAAVVIERYGMSAAITGLDQHGACLKCGHTTSVTLLEPRHARDTAAPPTGTSNHEIHWHGDIRSAHIQLHNSSDGHGLAWFRPISSKQNDNDWQHLTLKPGEKYRFMVSQGARDESGIQLSLSNGVTSNMHEVFDRAHFPTESMTDAGRSSDVSPLPIYESHNRS